MQEDKPTNESALELRLKQVTRYVTLGLLGVLALCALLFMYIGSVKQSEKDAKQNSQVQADLTKDSTFCSVYPNDEICVLSRKIAADPTQVVVPKDGINGEKGDKGDKGASGRGVTSFDISTEGNLVVAFTDGTTKDVGKVVGANGIDGVDGVDGKEGRGILSAGLDAGNLIIRFTDGSTENVGMVVGPAGAPGSNGESGAVGDTGPQGEPGKDGISVIDLKVDDTGTVVVYYSNNTSAIAGKVIVNTVIKLTCESDTLTMTMVDGQTLSATVDCTPDNIPPAAAANPAPLVTIP